jgi:hypothetical protein
MGKGKIEQEQFESELIKKGYKRVYGDEDGEHAYSRVIGPFTFGVEIGYVIARGHSWELNCSFRPPGFTGEMITSDNVDFVKRGRTYDIQRFNQSEHKLVKYLQSEIISKIQASAEKLEAMLKEKK